MSVWSKFIQSICGLFNKATSLLARQNGQALPITLAAAALGAMVVGPFLSHASTSLIGSNTCARIIKENYAADAGAEQAIWNLTYGSLAGRIPAQGDQAVYALPLPINGIPVNLAVSNLGGARPAPGGVEYEIQSTAGGTVIKVKLDVTAGVISGLAWQIKRVN
jgi:hypothetical protein